MPAWPEAARAFLRRPAEQLEDACGIIQLAELTVAILVVVVVAWTNLEREKSLELSTSTEFRTIDLNLGKVALYQLSYSRMGRYFSGKAGILPW